MNKRKTETTDVRTEEIRQRAEMETDRALGRCPFCHGRGVLLDPVIGDNALCICTGLDPNTVLGIA